MRAEAVIFWILNAFHLCRKMQQGTHYTPTAAVEEQTPTTTIGQKGKKGDSVHKQQK
jgi:hypothetical protein